MSESAPRISPDHPAVEFWAKRRHAQNVRAISSAESLWAALGEEARERKLGEARDDLTAILPLLCGSDDAAEYWCRHSNSMRKDCAECNAEIRKAEALSGDVEERGEEPEPVSADGRAHNSDCPFAKEDDEREMPRCPSVNASGIFQCEHAKGHPGDHRCTTPRRTMHWANHPTGNSLSGEPGDREHIDVRLPREQAEHLFGRCTESTNAPKINGYSCEDCRAVGEILRAALTQPKDTHLSGDGERLKAQFFDALDAQVRERQKEWRAEGTPTVFLADVHAALDTFLATRLSPDHDEVERMARTLRSVCWTTISTEESFRKAAEGVLAAHPRLSPEGNDPAAGLPPELAKALRDPTIIIDRDRETKLADGRTLAEHLEEWRKAPSNTASAPTYAEVCKQARELRIRAEKAEQELERVRAEFEERLQVQYNAVDLARLRAENLDKQVRAEGERLRKEAKANTGEAADWRQRVGEAQDEIQIRLEAILDSSPSLSGGGESSGVSYGEIDAEVEAGALAVLETKAQALLDALETAEKLAAGGEAQEASVNRVLTSAARDLAFALDDTGKPSLSGDVEERGEEGRREEAMAQQQFREVQRVSEQRDRANEALEEAEQRVQRYQAALEKTEAAPRLEPHHVQALLGAIRPGAVEHDDDLPEALDRLRASLTQQSSTTGNSLSGEPGAISGTTEAGTKYTAHFEGEPSAEQLKALEVVVDVGERLEELARLVDEYLPESRSAADAAFLRALATRLSAETGFSRMEPYVWTPSGMEMAKNAPGQGVQPEEDRRYFEYFKRSDIEDRLSPENSSGVEEGDWREQLERRVLRVPEPTPKQEALMEEFSDEMPTWAQLSFVQAEVERMREEVRKTIAGGDNA